MLKLGIIGAGGHGVQSHWVFAEPNGFQVTAVYDVDYAQVRARLAEFGISPEGVYWAKSVDDLLQQGLDALVIASLDHLHPGQLAAAIKAGIPTLVDKPAAIDEPGLRIVRTALKTAPKGLVVSSCHPRRFDPPYMALKERFAQLTTTYGALVHVEMDFSYSAPQASWKAARSLLLDHFPHEYDFLRWLLLQTGELPVRAYRLHDSFDHYAVSGVFGENQNAVTFMCMGTRRSNLRGFPETVKLRFTYGSCEVNTKTGMMAVWHHGSPADIAKTYVGETDYDLRFTRIMADFAAAVLAGHGVYLTPADILANTAVSIALARKGEYRS